ncbi:hypothetical protein [Microbacterium sp.]|uniref:hypothetical protein n=1 Tax=Microbacterium sp. TaxID=51671 RepID=UPI003221D858
MRSVLGRRVPLTLAIAGLVGHQLAGALVPVLIDVVIDEAIAPGDPRVRSEGRA